MFSSSYQYISRELQFIWGPSPSGPIVLKSLDILLELIPKPKSKSIGFQISIRGKVDIYVLPNCHLV